MKKILLLVPAILMFLFSCEKDELNDIDNDVQKLQDSLSVVITQHNSLLDSISELINTIEDTDKDIKALKMEQIGSLFESMARQPEAADMLIKSTEILYKDYTELLPLSDKEIEVRGEARGIAFSSLFMAIARQPEAFNKLDSAATKFLGVYNSEYISNELLDYTKIFSSRALNESIARQPEADSIFNIATTKYLNFKITE